MSDLCATFEERGFATAPRLLSEAQCAALEENVARVDVSGAGSREFLHLGWARDLARQLREFPTIRRLLGNSTTAVQCSYFAKHSSRNWLVALHQDLSIPVEARRADVPCHGWSEKDGVWFCQPPLDVLSQLIALRVHIDDCTEANGPLRVIPGSHRLGRIAANEVIVQRELLGEVSCVVARRGILAMRPLLLHASSKSTNTAPRRVLHYLFGPATLPWGLRWKHAF
jgi:hypothetical protein